MGQYHSKKVEQKNLDAKKSFHLYEVQNQAKLISAVTSEGDGGLWRRKF